ncbi:MAG: hypothetical protein Q9220_001816 [cf. Caloplaca sp. 1 TL-2023]
MTRSQSRDIEDTTIESNVECSDQGKAAPSNSEGNRGSSAKAGNQKKGSKPGPRNRRLTEVAEADEESQILYPTLAERDTDTHPEQRHQALDSPGNASRYSGTTVQTSPSAQELAATNAEEMVASLKDLSDESDKILDLLLPKDLSSSSLQAIQKKTSNPKSLESKQLARYRSNFQAYLEIYGDSQFINTSSVVMQMLGSSKQSTHSGPWRADPLLYKANLAAVIMALLAQHDQSLDTLVDELDDIFPLQFVGAFVEEALLAQSSNSSALYQETFQLGLDLRTFSFIARAKRVMDVSDFDPDSLLQHVFYQDAQVIKGLSIAGVRSEDVKLEERLRNLIISRLDSLRQTFAPNKSPPIDLEKLERDFSHDQLTKDLAYWVRLRLHEVQMQIQGLGDAQGIEGALQAILRNNQGLASETMDGASSPNPARPLTAEGSKAPVTYKFNSPAARPKAISRLKELDSNRRMSKNFNQGSPNQQDQTPSHTKGQAKAAPASSIQDPPASKGPALTLPRSQTDNADSDALAPSWQPPPIDDEQDLFVPQDTDPVIVPDEIIRRKHQIEDERNKENVAASSNAQSLPQGQPPTKKPRFIDPQPNAERLTWDSQQTVNVPTSNRSQPAVEASQAEGNQEEEVSEDEGFEPAVHPVAQSKRDRPPLQPIRPEMPSSSTPKRSHIVQVRPEPIEAENLDDAVSRHNEANPMPSSQMDTYKRVNSTAKTLVAVRPKKVQTRTPWSEEETDRFLDLIQEHGISWSKLKDRDENHPDGEKLNHRGQVALKDKARNMKVDYLK